MKKFLKVSVFSCLIITALGLIVFPERYTPLFFEGLRIWALKLLPSLLPLSFITALSSTLYDMTKPLKKLTPLTEKLYNLNGVAVYAQVLGICCGYPTGAKITAELSEKGLLDEKQSLKTALLSSSASPSFAVTTVGAALFLSKKAGLIILCAQLFSAILTTILFRKYGDNRPIARDFRIKREAVGLFDAALSSSLSVLAVGTLVIAFYLFYNVLSNLKITLPLCYLINLFTKDIKLAEGVTAGLFECTQGCLLLSECNSPLSIPLCSAIISFGGLSVLAQSAAFLQKANVNLKIFISGKLVQAALSFIICAVMNSVL